MAKVFLSYQKPDTNIARRIYDRLTEALGQGNVLVDSREIDVDNNVINTLSHDLDGFNVMMVVIGKDWAERRDQGGNRLLENPNYPVHQVVKHGLEAPNVTLIPLLVDEARMPTPESLPADLQAITQHEAFAVRNDANFEKDMQTLVEVVGGMRRLGMRGVALIAVIAIAATIFAVWLVVAMTMNG